MTEPNEPIPLVPLDYEIPEKCERITVADSIQTVI